MRPLLPLLLLWLLAMPCATASQTLDVGLTVFATGVAGASQHKQEGIFPKIREAEASYLPYVLRRALMQSNQWGAVRVLPEMDHAAALLIEGKILRSDGIYLELQLRATDASGRVWLDKRYRDSTEEADYLLRSGDRPPLFQGLFQAVVNDLAAAEIVLAH